MQTAWVRPRYPVPMTVTRGNGALLSVDLASP
jgi:hypothetical protein